LFIANITARLATWKIRVDGPIGSVNIGECLLLCRILNNNPVPSLAIATSWGLESNFETFFDNFAFYGLLKVEALAHAAGGFEDFFGGKVQLHGI
jgi:hypothetical protein